MMTPLDDDAIDDDAAVMPLRIALMMTHVDAPDDAPTDAPDDAPH